MRRKMRSEKKPRSRNKTGTAAAVPKTISV